MLPGPLPAIADIYISQGADYYELWGCEDNFGVAQVLTGCQFRLQIKQTQSQTDEPIITLDSTVDDGNGTIVVDATAGTFYFFIPETIVFNFDWVDPAFYDLHIYYPIGSIVRDQRLMMGRVYLSPGVTTS